MHTNTISPAPLLVDSPDAKKLLLTSCPMNFIFGEHVEIGHSIPIHLLVKTISLLWTSMSQMVLLTLHHVVAMTTV